MPAETYAQFKDYVVERQVSRLYVVGSNDTTAAVIDASYRRGQYKWTLCAVYWPTWLIKNNNYQPDMFDLGYDSIGNDAIREAICMNTNMCNHWELLTLVVENVTLQW